MKRAPQLALRLDAATQEVDAQWRAGGTVAHLGRSLTLILDTAAREVVRLDNELHLPLPPAAATRQIRDAAESWLREEALRRFTQVANENSALAGRRPPRVALVFGRRGDWATCTEGELRCHWRLIEQPSAVIAQVIDRALAHQQTASASDDLFALI